MKIFEDQKLEFVTLVRKYIGGEQNWTKWKNNGCQEYEKNPVPEGFFQPPGGEKSIINPLTLENAGKFIADGTKLGSPELTRLWSYMYKNISVDE